MIERPILFSAPMVRALLNCTKSQTRRVCTPAEAEALGEIVGPFDDETGTGWFGDAEGDVKFACPYGKPGDRLWVREAFSGPYCMEAAEGIAAVPPSKWGHSSSIWFWADGDPQDGDWTKPRPSIHMPRWASRILLEIVSVRVERLQDISEADARAEGCDPVSWNCAPGYEQYTREYREGFRKLWSQINGSVSWNVNPWVWVVEFKQVTP